MLQLTASPTRRAVFAATGLLVCLAAFGADATATRLGARSAAAQETATADARVRVTVVLPAGEAGDAKADAAVERAAVALLRDGDRLLTPPSRVGPIVRMRVETSAARAREIAGSPGVRVFPWRAPRLHDERTNVVVTGAVDAAGQPTAPGYRAWLDARGLGGAMATVIDFVDSGFDVGSASDVPSGLKAPDGASRVVYARDFSLDGDAHDVSGHGTLNVSVAAGSDDAPADAGGYAYGLGVAPGARVGSSRIFGDDGQFDFFGDYATIAAAAYADGARVSNNSWGSPSNLYDPDAIEWDAVVRDCDPTTPGAQEMVVVVSVGNAGPAGHVESPATAKNVITVGAAEGVRPGSDGCGVGPAAADSSLDMAFFSGGGPVDDGRIKPDLVAPATHVVGARSRAEGYTGDGVCDKGFPGSPDAYTWSSGTSHAAPVVSGAAALLYERLSTLRGSAPSPALVKAWLLNSTRYLTGLGAYDDLPSPRQGWGMLDLARAFDDAPRLVSDRDRFTVEGQSREWVVAPADASRPVRLTLAWTDAPGQPGTTPEVNDLDLEVEANGALYHANHFSLDQSTPGGTRDTRNNVESVWLPAGASPLRVRVLATALRGDGVPGNGFPRDQDFALVAYNVREAASPLLRVSAAAVEGDAATGGIDPGGSGTVRLTIANGGTLAGGADVTLTGGPGVTVLDGADALAPLAPGASATLARGFRVALDASVPCGAPLGLVAHLGSILVPVEARAGAIDEETVFSDDVEGDARWHPETATGFAAWTIDATHGTGGSRAWHGFDAASRLDASLVSDPILIPADAVSATFRFAHSFDFEKGFDGGVLEVSDGGPWVDLGPWMVSGGYDFNVSEFFRNPLGTRPAWTGASGPALANVAVDLTGYAGRTIRLRLRSGSDDATGAGGWYADDFRVVAERPRCAAPGGALPAVVSASYKNGKLKIKVSSVGADVALAINGRLVRLPLAYRADKGVLKVKAEAADLNLSAPGSNRLEVRSGGRVSRPFAFGL